METTTMTTAELAELDWANEQLERIPPHKQAIREFDASADGARYRRFAGMTMWENLGADTLPADAAGLEETR